MYLVGEGSLRTDGTFAPAGEHLADVISGMLSRNPDVGIYTARYGGTDARPVFETMCIDRSNRDALLAS